jgi:UDP-N-acetylmuramyl pentapeptide phosphotransferase/UDP-N-acetylglucosamine-1-phosphate transferase
MKYALLFAVSFAMMKLYLYVADRFNIIDKPNSRSSHSQVTIRGGGILFPVVLFAWFFFNGFSYPFFFSGLLLVSLISFLDDIYQLSSRLRFLVQTISVSLLFLQFDPSNYPIWALLISGILALGILNVYNFMDGINGITAGYSLAVLSGLWLVNNYHLEFVQNELIYFIAIAILIFSFFNFRKKAVCFAGDIGSVSIAFILIFLLILLIQESHNLLYLLFLSVYGVDGLLTIVYRISLKQNIFKPHRMHIYQLLANELKLSHLFVSTIYAVTQLLICFLVYRIIKSSIDSIYCVLFGIALVGFLSLAFALIRLKINRITN